MTSQDFHPALSADGIVGRALEIADAEGVGALSMRRLAADLDCATMSLYRHVAGKDELLLLMADDVLGRLPQLYPGQPWQKGARRFFVELHELLLRHPAVAHIMLERPVRGRRLTERGDALLALMLDGGLPEGVAAEALGALTWFTVGGALYAIARGGPDAPQARFADLDDASLPTLRRVREHFGRDATREAFHHGLDHLIRGYEGS